MLDKYLFGHVHSKIFYLVTTQLKTRGVFLDLRGRI
jgi:hypothetical protein